jgi:hypothetical protein
MNVRKDGKNAKQSILASLGMNIEPFGFSPKPHGQSFYRKMPNAKAAIHISFIPHSEDIDLTVDVALRLDSIEELVNSYDSLCRPADKRNSMTIGGELGNVSIGRFIRWTIIDIDSISDIVVNITEAVRKVAIPFIMKYNDIRTTFYVLSSSKRDELLLCPILGPRLMRIVAAAYLLNLDLDKDIDICGYNDELVSSNDLYLSDFRSLCDGLIKNSRVSGEQVSILRPGD